MIRPVALAALAALASCRGCKRAIEPLPQADFDEETEEGEDSDEARVNFWRAQIVIVGQGRVATAHPVFDCVSDGAKQTGVCGPKLVKFKELDPPLLIATPAAGWRFDHWDTIVRRPDGTTHPRTLPMPDGPRYMNGFGYSDTGELETVTAVFVPAPADR